MAEIFVNGISREGKSIKIINNRVFIDGVEVTPPGAKTIIIEVTGSLDNIEADVCQTINIHGDAANVRSTSGDIIIGGTVNDSVTTTSGDISCSDVGGSVSTVSGDVNVSGKIMGSVRTNSGDILK